VLRALVVVILVLSAVSLFFANALFKKRELLTKRSEALEEQFIKLAKTLEAADAPDGGEVAAVMKDVSEVSEREITNPEKVNVLEGYLGKLETQNLPTLDFGNIDKRLQLRSVFALGADGKPELDPVDQKPRTKGPGTMQELLDQAFDRAKAQQAILNKTRYELAKKREDFSAAIEDINKLKISGRTALVELKGEKGKVAQLETEKTELTGKVTKLTAEKRELTAELADAKSETERLKEESVTLAEDLSKSRDLVEELKKKMVGVSPSGGGDIPLSPIDGTPSAGDKGKIIEANDELKFAVIALSDDAMDELLGAERQNALPQLEMNVRRTGRQSAAGEFVTRIKLRQAVRGKNFIIADILNDWQQTPVEKGDVVFF
jgi:myosin heavy subunit